jgi:hypothetical protein
MRRLIKIYDITLRDGTQGEGVSCSMEDAPVQIVALTSGPGGRAGGRCQAGFEGGVRFPIIATG